MQVIQYLPNLELLKKGGRLGTNLEANGLFPCLSFLRDLNLSALESANVQHRFFALEWALVEDDAVSDRFSQFWRQLMMEPSLCFPDAVEFVQVVLPVEGLLLQAIMWVGIQMLKDVLSDGLLVEKEFLGTIADLSKITTTACDCSVDVCYYVSQFLPCQLSFEGFLAPAILLKTAVCSLVFCRVDTILREEYLGGLGLGLVLQLLVKVVRENI